MSSPRTGGGRRPSWSWQDNGRCRGASVWLFYGRPGEQKPERDEREDYAKRTFCRRCPVRVPCLEHALEYREDGVWGGMSAEERTRERRRRARLAKLAADRELAEADTRTEAS